MNYKFLSLAVCLLLLFLGCSGSPSKLGGGGSLIVSCNFPESIKAKVIPENTFSILIQVSGVGLPSPLQATLTGEQREHTFTNIPAGEKQVFAQALSLSGVVLASGNTSVIVPSGQTATANVTLEVVPTPTPTGTLTPATPTETPTPISTPTPVIGWARAYGASENDQCESLSFAPPGFALAGWSSSFSLPEDALLLRVDNQGNLLWFETIGGPAEEHIDDHTYLSDGGFCLVGDSYSWYPHLNGLVIKTNDNGAINWAKLIIGSGTLESVIETADKNILIAGLTGAYSQQEDWILLKVDMDGNRLWGRVYGREDYVEAIGKVVELSSPDKEIILAGTTSPFGIETPYGLVIMNDNQGNILWGMMLIGDLNEIRSVVEGTDGNIYLTGAIGSNDNQDILIVSMDRQGDINWVRRFGGNDFDRGEKIIRRPEGDGIILVGTTTSWGTGGEDTILIELNNQGEVVWARVFGGNGLDECWGLVAGDSSGLALGGTTSSWGKGMADGFLISTNLLGISCIGEDITGQVQPLPVQVSTEPLGELRGTLVTPEFEEIKDSLTVKTIMGELTSEICP